MSSPQNPIEMSSPQSAEDKYLEKIYIEASQWVRLANTVIWSMGTLLVPISLGFVGLALNKADSTKFDDSGKKLLCIGSVFLFSFWVYASFLYTRTSRVARAVLVSIEREWKVCERHSAFYTKQRDVILVWYRLPHAQLVALVVLMAVWAVIIWYPL